jgi:hypothetical protein
MNPEPRPGPKIVNHFQVVAASSGLAMGDFKWAVQSGIAIVHDGLSRHEATVLAWTMNREMDRFRAMLGLGAAPIEQLELILPPMALAPLKVPAARAKIEASAPAADKVARKRRAA